jgi:hypothetical protein
MFFLLAIIRTNKQTNKTNFEARFFHCLAGKKGVKVNMQKDKVRKKAQTEKNARNHHLRHAAEARA